MSKPYSSDGNKDQYFVYFCKFCMNLLTSASGQGWG